MNSNTCPELVRPQRSCAECSAFRAACRVRSAARFTRSVIRRPLVWFGAVFLFGGVAIASAQVVQVWTSHHECRASDLCGHAHQPSCCSSAAGCIRCPTAQNRACTAYSDPSYFCAQQENARCAQQEYGQCYLLPGETPCFAPDPANPGQFIPSSYCRDWIPIETYCMKRTTCEQKKVPPGSPAPGG